jgi:hypothetical protein
MNFLLFDAIWTILALAYLILAPLFFHTAAHKYGILAVEVLTSIFWFAGWVAAASFIGNSGCHISDVCKVATATTVFSAFLWYVTKSLFPVHCSNGC